MTLTDVTKRYGDVIALDHVCVTLEKGSITAVLGESGAGKSTLLSVIAGAIPFEGKAEGAGRVSYLFQNPKLLPNLTVEGNLRLVLPKAMWGEIPAMLGRVGLAERTNSRPGELSGGEMQRAAIARAFLYPHDTLLMDEPFSSLDLALKQSLIALTASLWREKRETVVFVTHDTREAAALSHRALVLKQGKIVADLPAGEDVPRAFSEPSPLESALVRILLEG